MAILGQALADRADLPRARASVDLDRDADPYHALDHIDAHRLIAAPDCGLGMQTRDSAVAKLTNLCLAAKAVG